MTGREIPGLRAEDGRVECGADMSGRHERRIGVIISRLVLRRIAGIERGENRNAGEVGLAAEPRPQEQGQTQHQGELASLPKTVSAICQSLRPGRGCARWVGLFAHGTSIDARTPRLEHAPYRQLILRSGSPELAAHREQFARGGEVHFG